MEMMCLNLRSYIGYTQSYLYTDVADVTEGYAVYKTYTVGLM